jgi:hypothetical protein
MFMTVMKMPVRMYLARSVYVSMSIKVRSTKLCRRLRLRISRLVCKALSFSKKLANHIGTIKYFICHYNQEVVRLV